MKQTLLNVAAAAMTLMISAGCAVTRYEIEVASLGEPEPPMQTPARDITLCLSGGGYRAALFHVGTLSELNNLGLLPRIDTVAGVSAGGIVGAWLASAWPDLDFNAQGQATNFEEAFVQPLRHLTENTIDVGGVLSSLNPGGSNRVAEKYSEYLFGDRRFAELSDAAPRTIVLATELTTGLYWEFSKERMGERRLGYVHRPDIRVADAVAASSAFPFVFRPVRLQFDDNDLVLSTPSEQDVARWTIEAFRDMGRDDLAEQLETYGIPTQQLDTLAADYQTFHELAFASKIGDGIFLIDGGVMNNLASAYCHTDGINVISNASTRWLGEQRKQPNDLVESLIRIIITMRRYMEAQERELLHRRHMDQHFARPCEPDGLDCASGTLVLVELAPVETLGVIPEEVDVPTRMRELPPETAEALINWGKTRARSVINGLRHGHLEHH
jgi:predicted acylesterase/phospholipase RssA